MGIAGMGAAMGTGRPSDTTPEEPKKPVGMVEKIKADNKDCKDYRRAKRDVPIFWGILLLDLAMIFLYSPPWSVPMWFAGGAALTMVGLSRAQKIRNQHEDMAASAYSIGKIREGLDKFGYEFDLEYEMDEHENVLDVSADVRRKI